MTTYTGALPFTLAVDEAGYSLTDGATSPPPPSASSHSAMATYAVCEVLSVIIPGDDTIPQSNEGTHILSVTHTAKSSTSVVKVRFEAFGMHETTDNALISALFIDAETNARKTVPVSPPGTGYSMPLSLSYQYVPGDTNPHTYKIRVGSSAGSMRLNGTPAGRLFGGSSAATLTVDDAGDPP